MTFRFLFYTFLTSAVKKHNFYVSYWLIVVTYTSCQIQQVNIHTDTLNESGFVEHTIAAFRDRTIHTYHRYNLHSTHPTTAHPNPPGKLENLKVYLYPFGVCRPFNEIATSLPFLIKILVKSLWYIWLQFGILALC